MVRNAAPLPVARPDGAGEHRANADADPPCRRANRHEHGKGESHRGDGFRTDPAEIGDLDELRQRHGEEAENHVPGKAYQVAR